MVRMRVGASALMLQAYDAEAIRVLSHRTAATGV